MILSKTLRTPICIDPQFKAIACIKAAHQHQNNVKFLRFDTTNDAVGELLKAITLGEIVVLEDVHAHIDPILMDLLEIKLLSWFSIHFSYHLPNFCMLFIYLYSLFAYSSILPFYQNKYSRYISTMCMVQCIVYVFVYVFLLLLFFFILSICFTRCLPFYYRYSPEIGSRQFAKVGSIEIEYNDGFRMYLVSHRSNPKFSAHMYSSAVIINFNTTLSSLENQLLDIIFASRIGDAELAHKRVDLFNSLGVRQKQLHDLEAGFLTQIASSDGNLLDNPNTMKLLECTKHDVQELNALICATKNTLANIETKRNDFRLIALKAASLFFVLADMAAINPFYQHAMSDFIDIFTQIMVSVQTSDGGEWSSGSNSGSGGGDDGSNTHTQCVRMNQCLLKIIADLSKRIYNIGSIGIFQKDKLLFALRIAMELEHCDGRINRKEMEVLLRRYQPGHRASGDHVGGGGVAVANISCDWLTNQQLSDIHQLTTAFPAMFGNFFNQIEMNSTQWKAWLHASQPESINYPEPCALGTTPFQVKAKTFYVPNENNR